MFGRSYLTTTPGTQAKFEYNEPERSPVQYTDVDRQTIYVKDDDAVIYLPGGAEENNHGTDEKLLKIEGLKTEVVYSSGTTHALLIEANNDWYKLFRAVLTPEQQIQADCLGLGKLITNAKVDSRVANT